MFKKVYYLYTWNEKGFCYIAVNYIYYCRMWY